MTVMLHPTCLSNHWNSDANQQAVAIFFLVIPLGALRGDNESPWPPKCRIRDEEEPSL